VKIRVRSIRVPQIGEQVCIAARAEGDGGDDVHSGGHALLVRGVTPDIIVNTHAIPRG